MSEYNLTVHKQTNKTSESVTISRTTIWHKHSTLKQHHWSIGGLKEFINGEFIPDSGKYRASKFDGGMLTGLFRRFTNAFSTEGTEQFTVWIAIEQCAFCKTASYLDGFGKRIPFVPQQPPARQLIAIVREVGLILRSYIDCYDRLSAHRLHHIG